jgi:hypothetical protein
MLQHFLVSRLFVLGECLENENGVTSVSGIDLHESPLKSPKIADFLQEDLSNVVVLEMDGYTEL